MSPRWLRGVVSSNKYDGQPVRGLRVGLALTRGWRDPRNDYNDMSNDVHTQCLTGIRVVRSGTELGVSQRH